MNNYLLDVKCHLHLPIWHIDVARNKCSVFLLIQCCGAVLFRHSVQY